MRAGRIMTGGLGISENLLFIIYFLLFFFIHVIILRRLTGFFRNGFFKRGNETKRINTEKRDVFS